MDIVWIGEWGDDDDEDEVGRDERCCARSEVEEEEEGEEEAKASRLVRSVSSLQGVRGMSTEGDF